MTSAAAATVDAVHIDDAPATRDAALSTWQAWRWWLPPALLALLFTLLFIDPFAGDWDALDYTVNSVRGMPSSMLFGRMLFIFTNHAAYRLAHAVFDLPNDQAYLLFKYMVVAECPLAVVGCWRLARELSGSLRTATVAALMLALSPFFIVYSGQAMTETPSILLLCLALVVHARGVRARQAWPVLAGAALLGLCVNIREPVGFFGLWLILAPACYGWQLKRRELFLTALACIIFFVCALAPFATWWLLNVDNYRAAWYGWVQSMRMESARHPVSPGNLIPFFGFFLVAAPTALLALPFAARREWRERGLTPLLTMALVGLFVNFVLLANYSVVINGRYLLTGLPALVPLAADYLTHLWTARTKNVRRGFVSACALVVSVALATGSVAYALARQTLMNHASTKDYRARLAWLPPDAVVMAGGQTVAVNYYRSLGYGHWDTIGTGGGWPGAELTPLIEGHLQTQRRVFLDVDPRLWAMNKWREQETRALVRLQSRFRFRRVSGTIYEIRPPDDGAANDDPNLQSLLNQPASGFSFLR
ncbi:MAG: glycosyltransferase family 39 protein [Pyrinomonadaceae bacterium]